MSRYITVVHKSNNGINNITQRKTEVDYDVVRFDTQKNEYIYGSDNDYTLEHFSFDPSDIFMINPYTSFTEEEFDAINEELLAVGDENIEELATNEGFCGFLKERLTDAQFNIIEKYRKMLYDREVNECIKEYNNDFSIENGLLREENKQTYLESATPTSTCYYDEKGKLYRIINGSVPEMIHDSKYPEKIRKDLID